MGIKGLQANAPELTQILLQSPDGTSQLPHNPQFSNYNSPPPPYNNEMPSAGPLYPQQPNASYQRPASSSVTLPAATSHRNGANHVSIVPSTVVMQTPVNFFDVQERAFRKKVRRFNIDLFFVALGSIVTTYYALHLYHRRHCYDYVITQIGDNYVMLKDLVNMHLYLIWISFSLLLASLAQCCSCGKSRSAGYRAVVALISFAGLCLAGLMAYLAFYSTCSGSTKEIASNAIDTFSAALGIRLPSPEQRLFGKQNVFEASMDEDPYGRIIFFSDLFNAIVYLSTFISVLTIG